MKSTKKKSLHLLLATIFIIAGFAYAALVTADYAVSAYMARLEKSFGQSEAAAIIDARKKNEDLPQRAIAIAEGYAPLLYPNLVETQPQLRALAARFGVAPLAPHPNTRLYFCNEGYGLVKYVSDRFGFRNEDATWDGKVEVALIGDSFVHGACVADNQSLSGKLSEKTPTLNLGTNANAPVHYAAVIKTFLPVIKPRWAVLVFVDNDNRWGEESSLYNRIFFGSSPTYFREENGKLVLSDPVKKFYDEAAPIVQALKDAAANESNPRLLPRSKTQHFELRNLKRLFQQAYAVVDNRLAFSSQLAIDALVATCTALGCKPVVCYLPNSPFWQVDPRGPKYAAALGRLAHSKNAAFLDFSAELGSLGREAYAIKGPHLSPTGYKLVAERLMDLFSRSQQ